MYLVKWHEFSPQKVAKEGTWDPSFQGNLGWWNIIFWPDVWESEGNWVKIKLPPRMVLGIGCRIEKLGLVYEVLFYFGAWDSSPWKPTTWKNMLWKFSMHLPSKKLVTPIYTPSFRPFARGPTTPGIGDLRSPWLWDCTGENSFQNQLGVKWGNIKN